MNNTLAVIDIDGIIANPDARLAHALSVYMSSIPDEIAHLRTKKCAETSDVYWSTAFRPDLVSLDTPVEGALQAISKIIYGLNITSLLLTSRPESMRQATEEWLKFDGFIGHVSLVMKPPAAQFVKTATWKASIVDTLAMYYEATTVLFVDDTAACRDEVVKHLDAKRFSIEVYVSLDELGKTIL